MGFYIDIEDEQGRTHKDERWNNKPSYRDEFWTSVQKHWTDVVETREEDKRRPANEGETAALRAAIQAWPEDKNRDLFLYAIDVVAKNPALRFVPSY